MSVRLRLQRKGRKKRPFYHIVAADIRAPRDGKFIERLGSYDPSTKPATIHLDKNRAFYWMRVGAQPTNTVRAILRFKGLYYKKHLQRGVAKGAMTQEQADELLNDWIAKKEAKVEARRVQTAQEIEAHRKRVFGKAPTRPDSKDDEAPVEDAAATETPVTEEGDTTEA